MKDSSDWNLFTHKELFRTLDEALEHVRGLQELHKKWDAPKPPDEIVFTTERDE